MNICTNQQILYHTSNDIQEQELLDSSTCAECTEESYDIFQYKIFWKILFTLSIKKLFQKMRQRLKLSRTKIIHS